ncbi:hypothetical protein BACT_1057 [Bifidobacterium actinocoloniiforme DSM 22766]|uniref:Uncharacterized protein n=1 Tax=Bifidobacterium actinocoloniiforme DSM 22766 TaxID=1437605 RepID=A0A086Z1F5_9BIFI|nr:transcriptional regulator [Bifidobacterium actinocoloniiforme]KFI40355.1 hypothetical protein BACT_1057 [Bifidobacterium actinocoloniiforme DSM 22766]
MTPAEFKATRESLHLPLEWLADRWGVLRQSVQRWERGDRRIPDGIASDLEALEAQADLLVEDGADRGDDVLLVPRTDMAREDGMPAAWSRAIAKRVAARTGAAIEYGPGDR